MMNITCWKTDDDSEDDEVDNELPNSDIEIEEK